MSEKISLQEYSDRVCAAEYRQPLMSLSAACARHGWEQCRNPTCCGKPLELEGLIGMSYAACNTCGKFIADMSAPQMRNGYAQCVDHDKVDTRTPVRWIAGRVRSWKALQEPPQ